MADRAREVSPARAAAVLAAAVVLALTLGTLLAVALAARGSRGLGPADLAALRFTVWQAFLSAAISCAVAVPLARALARRRFPGRGLLITLMGAPFILPVVVAVFGLLAVFGRSGLISQALAPLGLGPLHIYGLTGVVLAHVFFNLPLATRLLIEGWRAIPSERLRTAAALDLPPRARFAHIEAPMLAHVLPGAFLAIFLVCLTSFAVALTLGGGPRATTIELAIYQSFTFDFDLARAARLAVLQFAVAGAAGLIAWRMVRPAGFGAGLDRPIPSADPAGRVPDAALIALTAAFLVLPLAMVALSGLAGLGSLPPGTLAALARSLAVALAAVFLMALLALPVALAAAARDRPRLPEALGPLLIAASPLVIGTGLFLVVFPLTDPASLALPVTALVNAAAALPFALRVLVPAARAAERDFGRLARSLDMPPPARLRLVTLPRLRSALGFAAGLTAALSVGDLGVITIFAGQDAPTLPLLMYRLMGAYRMEAAAAAALLLLLLSLGLFRAFDWWGTRDA